MKVFSCLAITGLMLSACATSTPSSSPTHQASTAAPATAAAPASDQVLTPVITTADDPRITAANRYAREMGYKIVTRQGVQFYCRKTAPIGSRLEQTQCLTVDGMAQARQIADENKNAMGQGARLCGPACASNEPAR